MFNCFGCCSNTMRVGAAVGGMTGFALALWAAVDLVQPALVEEGLSEKLATIVTAAMALGGIEICVAAGIFAGAVAAPVLTGGVQLLGHVGSCFFGGSKHSQPVLITRVQLNNDSLSEPLLPR